MAKLNKICVVCNTAYRYCSNCSDYIKYPTWMNMFCSKECIDVYQTMSAFESGNADKKAAKAILMQYKDNGKYKNYQKSFASTYAKIMAEDEEEKKIEPIEKAEEEIKEIKEDVSQSLAQQTTSEIKKNITAEAKKTYPKAIAHKHGK